MKNEMDPETESEACNFEQTVLSVTECFVYKCGMTGPQRDLGGSARAGGKLSCVGVASDSDMVSLQINIAGIM